MDELKYTMKGIGNGKCIVKIEGEERDKEEISKVMGHRNIGVNHVFHDFDAATNFCVMLEIRDLLKEATGSDSV